MYISRKKYIILLLTIVLFMTIGFAVLSTTLTINGNASINSSGWNIYFSGIVQSSANNVTATPTINGNNITSNVTLSKPGDYYSFVVDIVNDGEIDAMLDSFSKNTLTTQQETLLNYYVTYADGTAINTNDKLAKSSSETIMVVLEYDRNVTAGDLPSSAISFNLYITMNYVQATSSANTVTHSDLGNFIIKAKKVLATESDITDTTFDIDMGTYGTHKLRVANVSTPSDCSNDGFSQTACGVVLEFADIITTKKIYEYDTNVGGWPATSMRTFVNEDIYNELLSNLKSAIIETSVVSGHGSTSGETNFTSTDKLYLLSTHEVWSDGISNQVSAKDTSYNNTRQLDYYAGKNVTTSSYSGAIKKNGSTASWWWLRSANSSYIGNFLIVYGNGSWTVGTADGSGGVSPAFRIA